ncbi:hypothetical protein ACHAWF_005634 [Thalassiosira exigua]
MRQEQSTMALQSGIVVLVACALAVAVMGEVRAQATDAARHEQYSRYAFPDDPSIVVVEPHQRDDDDSGGRVLEAIRGNCNDDEGFLELQLTTDMYPWDTAWLLLDFMSGEIIDYGPPDGENYEQNSTYTANLCLPVGEYSLRMADQGGDDLLRSGEGSFKGFVDGSSVVKSDDSSFEQKDYSFTVNPPSIPPSALPLPLEDVKIAPVGPQPVVSFIFMGDVPHEPQRYCLNEQLRSLDPGLMMYPYNFIVHAGDIKISGIECNEEAYSEVAQIFAHTSNKIHYDTKDVFFLVGDNEWSDCMNRDKAFSFWMNSFGNGQKTNGRNTGPNPYGFGTLSDVAQTVTYDDQGGNSNSTSYPTSASNFAFYINQVLFLGIHQMSKKIGDEESRAANNFQWVKSNMEKYAAQMKTVVIFAHTRLLINRKYFGFPFQALLKEEYPDVFCLYAHGNDHEFTVGRVDEGNKNLVSLSCDMGKNADPLLVSIFRHPSGERDRLRIDRRGGQYGGSCDGGDEQGTWGPSFH